MANELISKDFSKHKIADVFKSADTGNDLGAGISGGFTVVGYRGKVWSYKRGGTEQRLMRPDGDGPRSSIDVVILSASKHLSKVWYEKGWSEGNNAPPDCWSGNGITPDPNSPKIQSATCASCQRNIWGGRITENGKRAKECTDSKRLAVVPLDDLAEVGSDVEPMLLRVPAASLSTLAAYGNEMSKLGYPYYSIATKVTFDPQESYPKFQFTATRPLDNDEGTKAIELRNDPLVERILAETSEMVVEGEAASPAPVKSKAEVQAPPVKSSKVINSTVAEPARSKVTPRTAAPKEEVEDAEVVEEPATPVEGSAGEAETEDGEEDEAFGKALDAKLSAFLGGKNAPS